jgi:hypothetical protein
MFFLPVMLIVSGLLLGGIGGAVGTVVHWGVRRSL